MYYTMNILIYLYIVLFIFYYGHFACMYDCAYSCASCPQRPEEDTVFPGTGVAIGCEPHVGAGNQTWVLWKGNKGSSFLWEHLSRPLNSSSF